MIRLALERETRWRDTAEEDVVCFTNDIKGADKEALQSFLVIL